MLRHVLHKLTRFHRQGDLPNIAIFSSARSGSTWLMELIATQPGFKSVDEPLHPDHLIECGIAQPPADEVWNLLLPNENRQAVLRRYFTSIERNEIHIGEPRFLSRFYRLRTNRIVFKILRAQDLMGWFQDTFGWQIVYLIRHPLATNLSRKQFPRLELFLKNELFISRYLSREQFEFSQEVQARGSRLQIGVLDWCLQNLPVLKNLGDRSWLLVHYEDLIRQPAIEIDRLASALSLSGKELMRRHLSEASGSTYQSDASTRSAFKSPDRKPSSEFLLTKWRTKLGPDDEEQAFQVLDAFEIDIYSRGEDLPVRRLETIASERRGCVGGTMAS
jgi:hypothetical protein